MNDDEVRVLVVDDSPTARRHLIDVVDGAEGLRVVGEARDGQEAVEKTAALRPDVVSMDIHMPGVNGLTATRLLMTRTPVPVVIVSGLVEDDIRLSLAALQAGALAVVPKPPHRTDPAFATQRDQLVNTLRTMAVTWPHRPASPVMIPATRPIPRRTKQQPQIVAIGASTGGPHALHALLSALPATLPVPLVIAQHMPREFLPGLADWLNQSSALSVALAHDGHRLCAGEALLAAGDGHLEIRREAGQLVARCLPDDGQLHMPSVDILFHAVASCCRASAIGIILTGMGRDGAEGLLALREAGGVTIAQDEHSSAVYGMPQAAHRIGAARYIINLQDLPAQLQGLLAETDIE